MSTVYVTQEAQWDFTPAEQFGPIEFLTKDDLLNVRSSIRNRDLLSDLRHRLKSYDPERDWLIITGSPYVSAAVFMLLGLRGLRTVRILRWDNRDRRYIPLYLEIPNGAAKDDRRDEGSAQLR